MANLTSRRQFAQIRETIRVDRVFQNQFDDDNFGRHLDGKLRLNGFEVEYETIDRVFSLTRK